MLDFSRLWPPEIPKPGVRASFLIRKLRPELVRSYSKPLCSDAFSRFQTGSAEEKAENSQDVADAFLHMLKELIPTLVAKLQKEISDPESIAKFNVTEALHEQGKGCSPIRSSSSFDDLSCRDKYAALGCLVVSF